MLRAVQIVGSNVLAGSNDISLRYFTPNFINMQSVRWKRKPIWLPTAKTKVFRVPPRPPIIEEEIAEIKRLNNNYRTYMKSITKYIRQSVAESQVQFDEAVIKKAEEEDFATCNAINDEWNKMIACQREQRLAQEKELRREKVLRRLSAKEERDAMIQREVDEHIKRTKMEAPSFITERNIDRAIQETLANIVDYNSAIDINGNICREKFPISNDNSTKDSATQQ